MRKLYVVYAWQTLGMKSQAISSAIIEVEHLPLYENDIDTIEQEIVDQINADYATVTIINWKELAA